MRIPRAALEHHVQRMLMADFCVSYADVAVDEDGDVGITTPSGVRVYLRLLYDVEDAAWVRVWSPAASDLRPTAKLLREVNEINQRSIGTRVLLTESRSLVVCAEVVAGSVEKDDLGILVQRLASAVTEVGALVQLVHGEVGRRHDDAARPAE